MLITGWPPTVRALNQPVVAEEAKLLVNPPFIRAPPVPEFAPEASSAVGVPLITPDEESVNPDGSDEPFAKRQVSGPVPPVDAKVVEYADPLVAPGTVVVVIAGVLFTVTVTVEEVVVVDEVVVVVEVKRR